MNTLIEYQYRDASNYKLYNRVVLAGELDGRQEAEIMSALDDGLWFIPSAVGLETLEFFDGETEDDHPWHELLDIDATVDDPTEEISANEFYVKFMDASGHWDDFVDEDD